jgi:sulfur-oxidizing protein SoxY
MNLFRRQFLRLTSVVGALGVTGLSALELVLQAPSALAAVWNKPGFESKVVEEVMKSLGATNAQPSAEIHINAPDIAENGAVVPIEVTSRINNTQSIALIAEKNPFPLAAQVELLNGAEPYFYVRIKMGQTSRIQVLVKADGKFYTAHKEIKITIGGCG